MKIVLVTGGFDPLHSGHITYFNSARMLGDRLIVGINSDAWLERKKGRAFMPLYERMAIVSNLKSVNDCVVFDDSDNTARDAIHLVKQLYPDSEIVFANGGDRTKANIPEMTVEGVEFVFSVGGDNKANSSSWILDEWKSPKTLRSWGYYRILHDVQGTKVKELTIEPHQQLSMQRHSNRSEYWFIAEGTCQVKTEFSVTQLYAHDEMFKIPLGHWHQLINPFDVPCKLIEIQYGTTCTEDDIERK